MFSISIKALLVSAQRDLLETVRAALSAMEAPCSLDHCDDIDQLCVRDDLGNFDVLIVDSMSAKLQEISEIRFLTKNSPVVWLTQQRDDTTGLEAIRCGASDYMSRQEMSPEILFRTLRYAVERSRVEVAMDAMRSQLFQSQKMEAIGRVASGLAHDFKQFVQVIVGYCAVLKNQVDSPEMQEAVEDIRSAGSQAGQLVERLLNFARTVEERPVQVDLNQILENNRAILKPLLDRGQQAVYSLESVPLVRLDPNQLEQVVMNLAVNAVDAMGENGRLEISTRSLDIERRYQDRDFVLSPGRYAVLEVSDNGSGIEPELLEQIFEPFFTTRAERGGTGLGLSIVFNLVKAWGGGIGVTSIPGIGTTFKIVIPAAEAEGKPMQVYIPRLGQPVLLWQTDAACRLTTRRDLSEAGYKVLESTDFDRAARSPNSVVLASVGQPGWERLAALPNTVLLTGLQHSLLPKITGVLLPTPFSYVELLSAISKASK